MTVDLFSPSTRKGTHKQDCSRRVQPHVDHAFEMKDDDDDNGDGDF